MPPRGLLDQLAAKEPAPHGAGLMAALQSMPSRRPDNAYPSQQGMASLDLTPQEQFLYQHHLDNLTNKKSVVNDNGSVSTVKQAIVSRDTSPGRPPLFYNIPTVWDGKILSPHEAMKRAAKLGWNNWPAHPSPDAAEARYEQMHELMDPDVEGYVGPDLEGY